MPGRLIRPAVLGLDLSLTCTGYAVLALDTEEMLAKGHIRPPKKGEMRDRIQVVVDCIREVREHWQPVDVWCEEPLGHHMNTAKILSRLYGAVIQSALEREPWIVNVSQVKALAEAREKDDIMLAAMERWGPSFMVDDEADAAWVALYGCRMFRSAMEASTD